MACSLMPLHSVREKSAFAWRSAPPLRVCGAWCCGQVASMTVIGGMIGVAVALGLGRFGESLFFQLNARDPMVLSVSCFLLVLVALAAGFIPAHRASRFDPLNALRYE